MCVCMHLCTALVSVCLGIPVRAFLKALKAKKDGEKRRKRLEEREKLRQAEVEGGKISSHENESCQLAPPETHTYTHSLETLEITFYIAHGQSFSHLVSVSRLLSSLLLSFSLSLILWVSSANESTLRGLWISTLKWQMMASCGSVQETHTDMLIDTRNIHAHIDSCAWTRMYFYTQNETFIHTRVHTHRHSR